MPAGQHHRVTLQLLYAEQLRAQDFSISVVTQRVSCKRWKPELFDDYDFLLALTQN